jgi:hypothetical protein
MQDGRVGVGVAWIILEDGVSFLFPTPHMAEMPPTADPAPAIDPAEDAMWLSVTPLDIVSPVVDRINALLAIALEQQSHQSPITEGYGLHAAMDDNAVIYHAD